MIGWLCRLHWRFFLFNCTVLFFILFCNTEITYLDKKVDIFCPQYVVPCAAVSPVPFHKGPWASRINTELKRTASFLVLVHVLDLKGSWISTVERLYYHFISCFITQSLASATLESYLKLWKLAVHDIIWFCLHGGNSRFWQLDIKWIRLKVCQQSAPSCLLWVIIWFKDKPACRSTSCETWTQH